MTRSELRNSIYDFAATKSADDTCCVLPCNSLAHICRQVRAEYLPICCKAPVTIKWNDVSRYLDTIYPSIAGLMQNVEHAPVSLTILVTGFSRNNPDTAIDLISLVKLHIAKPGFPCQFQRDPRLPYKFDDIHESPESEQRRFFKADAMTLAAVFRHNNQQWVDDINNGKVKEFAVTAIGTEDEPIARLVVDDEQQVDYPAMGIDGWNEDFERNYLEKVGLEDDVWTCDVDGDTFVMVHQARRALPCEIE
jgi:hypothetical protein